VSEVTLQHCVLKALLAVLDSGPGLAWVLAAPQGTDSGDGGDDGGSGHTAFEDIFLNIQVIWNAGARLVVPVLYAPPRTAAGVLAHCADQSFEALARIASVGPRFPLKVLFLFLFVWPPPPPVAQASGQRQHMGKMYALAASLCFSDADSPGGHGSRDGPRHGGRAAFMRCLDAVAEARPDRPRFDAVSGWGLGWLLLATEG
jgi:hypothetical protein